MSTSSQTSVIYSKSNIKIKEMIQEHVMMNKVVHQSAALDPILVSEQYHVVN